MPIPGPEVYMDWCDYPGWTGVYSHGQSAHSGQTLEHLHRVGPLRTLCAQWGRPMSAQLPRRAARIADEMAAEAVRLDLYGVPKTQIARALGINRRTVSRILDRTRAARRI